MHASIRRVAGSLLAAALVVAVAPGWAQDKGGKMQKQIVGTWTLVSAENTHADGKKSQPFGPTPNGMAMFQANGRFMVLNTNPATPKFASNNRSTGTAEENKAAMIGAISLFGTYKVNDADKSMSWHIDASTYPNWVGQDQKRPINGLTADELRYTNPAASTGAATTLLIWKRVK